MRFHGAVFPSRTLFFFLFPVSGMILVRCFYDFVKSIVYLCDLLRSADGCCSQSQPHVAAEIKRGSSCSKKGVLEIEANRGETECSSAVLFTQPSAQIPAVWFAVKLPLSTMATIVNSSRH
ncbi:hypothetical protein LX32DRAFT_420340 [Colletotrichum zoysiae]|uniref:Uncharacterized protein n=1 Tax=Colletotrichum zoysiae TaxID=1216348 RepID=A0AAD9HSE5_9PEZI|nr:hypothetical protein LX32DRAFT_420340 [Colletotrichum zoysiae]